MYVMAETSAFFSTNIKEMQTIVKKNWSKLNEYMLMNWIYKNEKKGAHYKEKLKYTCLIN